MIKADCGMVDISYTLSRKLLGDMNINEGSIPQQLKEAEIFGDLGTIMDSVAHVFGDETLINMIEQYIEITYKKEKK